MTRIVLTTYLFIYRLGINTLLWQGNRSKTPDNKPPGQKPPGLKPPDNKPPRIIEEIIAKYAVDANLFQLGSTSPKKKSSSWFFFRDFIPGAHCQGAFVQVAFVRRLFVGVAFELDSYGNSYRAFRLVAFQ